MNVPFPLSKNRIYIITVFSVCYCIVPVYFVHSLLKTSMYIRILFYFILFVYLLFIFIQNLMEQNKNRNIFYFCEIPKTKYKLLDFGVTSFSCLYICPVHQQCESSFSVDFPFKVQPWETVL